MGGFFWEPMNKKVLFAFLTCKTEEFIWPADKALYILSGQSVSFFGPWAVLIMKCNDCGLSWACHGTECPECTLCTLFMCALWTLMTVNSASELCLGCLWHGRKVQILPNQWHMQKPRGGKILSLRNVSCFLRFSASAFSGKGEMSVCQTWQVYDEATKVFCFSCQSPSNWLWNHCTSGVLRDWLLSSMTNPVLQLPLARKEESFCVGEWKNCCQLRMPFFSISDKQCNKLESGWPVCNNSKWFNVP